MNVIVTVVGIVAGSITAITGLGLAFASKVISDEKDERDTDAKAVAAEEKRLRQEEEKTAKQNAIPERLRKLPRHLRPKNCSRLTVCPVCGLDNEMTKKTKHSLPSGLYWFEHIGNGNVNHAIAETRKADGVKYGPSGVYAVTLDGEIFGYQACCSCIAEWLVVSPKESSS